MNKYSREVTVEQAQFTIGNLVNELLHLNERDTYVLIMGGYYKRDYEKLSSGGVEIKLIKSNAGLLKYIIPSYGALLKITNCLLIEDLFLKEYISSWNFIFSLNKEYSNSFVKLVNSKFNIEEICGITNIDMSSFWYSIDMDNRESRTEMYEVFSYGDDCPNELIKSVSLGNFR